jgi:hypothetical protein
MTTVIASNPSISNNVEFILSHLDSLWPKLIAVGDRFYIRATTFGDIISQFYRGKLVNCRINVYPDYTITTKKKRTGDFYNRRLKAYESKIVGGNGIVVSVILIDIDKGSFHNNLGINPMLLLEEALFNTLDNINTKFHGKFKPTISWSGNGYHIIQPVQLYGPSWCLGATEVFHKLHKDPDQEFLRWIGPYLSGNKSDPQNSKTVSMQNNYLRVPGTFNVKGDRRSEVKIVQRWDGQRPYINWVLRDFQNYLIQQMVRPKKASDHYDNTRFSTKWN